MTLNGEVALILRYFYRTYAPEKTEITKFPEFGNLRGVLRKSG